MLPDLRAMTLRALMKAGGVGYLVEQATANPQAFMNLLGKVMPRELHAEVSGELKIRAEVRRDLVEKVIVLMRTEPAEQSGEVIEATPAPLPAIAHTPDTMLKAARNAPQETNSRSSQNARLEGAAITGGVMQRATAMHLERSAKSSGMAYEREAQERIDGRRTTVREGERDAGRERTERERGAVAEGALSHAGAPGPVWPDPARQTT